MRNARKLGECAPLVSAGVGYLRFGAADTLDQVNAVKTCPVRRQMFSGIPNFDQRAAPYSRS